MEKKKGSGMASVYLLLAIFIVLAVGIFVFITMKSKLMGGDTIVIEDGRIVDGKDAWANFLLTSKSGQKSAVRFKFTGNGETRTAVLKYDDGQYTYKDKKGNKFSNKCIIDVSGTHPVTEKNSRMICLADEEYTFAQIVTGEAERDKEKKPYTIIISLTPDSVN